MFVSLWLVVVAGFPGIASAQDAVLYELVENLDTVKLLTTNHRVSHWTAQGSAQAGSPFCPAEVVPAGVSSCTITAFGMDDINLSSLTTEFVVGTVWANVVAVANLDNVVDGPEAATFSGQITGELIILQPNGAPPVQPDLGKKKSLLGPALPLIYIVNGKFFPDAMPTVRTSPPDPPPLSGNTASFESTFRLPFAVTKDGTSAPAQHGKNAYYLGDDGSLIKVDKGDEYSQGFPLLRGEVFFAAP